MIILGAKYFGPHDASACLVKDGRIVAFAEEERFVRVKHAPNSLPVNAISFCLNYAGITIRDVDYIACPRADPSFHRQHVFGHVISNLTKYLRMNVPYTLSVLLHGVVNISALTLSLGLRRHFGHSPPVVPIRHDVAHLASAFYASPFQEAKLLCVEGIAEKTSTLMGRGTKDGIECMNEVLVPNSLGLFYTAFTEWAGFEHLEGEGKLMGLAPYGLPTHDLQHVVWGTADGFEYDWRYGGLGGRLGPALCAEFGPRRERGGVISQHHKDVAASVQARLEEVSLHLLRVLSDAVPSGNLCLAGGVALNMKMNGTLLRSGLVERLFVQPVANDAGVAIGAALELSHRLGESCDYVMDHAYLGPSYTNEEIREELDRRRLVYEHHGEIAAAVADILNDGQIVGWFQGRMEAGPRALGNRSLLADPRDPMMKDRINERVKFREAFRPYCPSLLDEVKQDYLEDAHSSPFMTIAFQVRPCAKNKIPAVVHVDDSVRPQTVTSEANPLFHELIASFGRTSGVPVVLNTSLNVAGEPICCSPEDAIDCFLKTRMDAIALGNYLVRRCSNPHLQS